MSRHAAYTYYTTGDKLLKKIDFYNNDGETAYKTIEYAYNDRNQVTTITIKYDAIITDTITYTYNTDGTISDVTITHSVVEPEAELQNGGEGGTTEPQSGEENGAGGGTSEPQNEDNSEEVDANE